MPMPSNHIHSYSRIYGPTGKVFYRCLDADCYCKRPREEIVGKNNLCPDCKKETFVITWKHLRKKTPKCVYCANDKASRAFRAAEAVVKNLFPSAEEH